MRLNSRAEAYAPATIANLGVGFDILGLALREPGDIVRAQWHENPGVHILHVEGDGGLLPRESTKNTACISAQSVLRALGETRGVGLTLIKGLPLASGLGSSAASAVAAAVAVNALFGSPLSYAELLPASLDGEAAVSGYHADNVGPCLFGGINLIGGLRAEEIRKLPVPQNLHIALVTPDVAVPTAQARAVLPQQISLRQMVSQTAAVAQVMDALYRGDLEALGASMERDMVVEPARAHLMPMLAEVRKAAHEKGALGLVISGAGPTLCAVCDSLATAESVCEAMRSVYDEIEMVCSVRHTQVAEDGAVVVSVES